MYFKSYFSQKQLSNFQVGATYFFMMLFLYAGSKKLWEGDLFYHNLLASPVIGNENYAHWLAVAIPSLELLTALLLLLKVTKQLGHYLACFLLLLYTLYLGHLLFLSPGIPCTCRSFFPGMGWYGHFYFSLSCLFLALALLMIHLNTKTHTPTFVAQQKQEEAEHL